MKASKKTSSFFYTLKLVLLLVFFSDYFFIFQHLGIITIKTFVMYLVLFCDWELEEKPYWTRKT